MEVGVREFKQRLSEYIRRAAAGEVIQVTERGVAKAVLAPVPGRERLAEGVAAGWITPGDGSTIRRVRRARGAERIADVLAEERGS